MTKQKRFTKHGNNVINRGRHLQFCDGIQLGAEIIARVAKEELSHGPVKIIAEREPCLPPKLQRIKDAILARRKA